MRYAVRTAIETMVASEHWPAIQDASRVRKRRGVEIDTLPERVQVEVLCPACQERMVRVVRRRNQHPTQGKFAPMFLSIVCDNSENPGCSRGEVSRLSKGVLIDVLSGRKPDYSSLPEDQSGLF